MNKAFRLLIFFMFLSVFQHNIFAFEFPNADEVRKIAVSIQEEQYPDADEILIANVEKIKYSKDGTGENIDDVYLKVLTEKGRTKNRTISAHFHSHYQSTEFVVAELLKPDGRIVPVDIEKNSRISVSHYQMGSNIFDPNQKILSLNIPELEIGDIIHYRTVEKIIRTRMPNTWSDYIFLQYDQPILDYKVEVISPDELPIAKFAIRDEVEGTVSFSQEKGNGYTIYRWHAKNVPQIFPEPDMPPMYSVVQRLLLSTIPDWREISKWYWNLSQPRLERTSPAMEEEVKKLTTGKETDEEKMRAIFDFVSQKIRYMGITPEEEAPGYEPHDVCLTFENRYGVCRDKAALLTSMLRLAGFKAYPVLIMAGPKKDPEIPTPYFNHAIVAVEKEDGIYILMDMTNETTAELLPSYLCDKSYLVAKPEGETLKTSPIIPAEENLLLINTFCEIRNDFSARFRTEVSFNGINDSVYRGALLRRNPEQIVDFWDILLRNTNSRIKYISHKLEPQNLSDVSNPLKLSLEYEMSGIILAGTSYSVLTLPFLSGSIGMVNFLIEKIGLTERRFPLITDIACGVVEKITISKPTELLDVKIIIPNFSGTDHDALKWVQRYSHDERNLIYESEFILKQIEYAPSVYPELRKTLGQRELELKIFPVITDVKKEKSADDSGIQVISEITDITVKSDNEWTETITYEAELLDFSGKREISEVKIWFNDGVTSAKVDYARVISREGKVTEISEKEINIMDQPWTSGAPRYPPGKILVLSLPAVDIGSRVQYQITQKNKDRTFSKLLSVRSFNNISSKKIIIRNPNGIPLKIAENTGGKLSEKYSSKKEFIWQFENLPKIRKESNLPPAWASEFIAASAEDWSNLKDSWEKIIDEKSAGSSEAAKIAKRLFAVAPENSKEKIRLIRNFVAENIRDAGVSFTDLPDTAIADANIIFKSGYGTSIERAIALASLLKEINVKYEVIPSSNYTYLPEDIKNIRNIPMRNFIKSVLLKVEVEGEQIYLNESSQYAELGTSPFEGKIALTGGENVFSEICVGERFRTGIERSFEVKIAQDGSATIKCKELYYGNEHSKWKENILEMTPENLRRFFQEKASEIMLSAKIAGEPAVDFSVYPGKIEIAIITDKFANFAADKIYFVLPYKSSVFNRLQSFRQNPYFHDFAHFEKISYKILIPGKYTQAELIPQNFYSNISGEDNELSVKTEFQVKANSDNETVLHIDKAAKFSPKIFSGEDYERLLKNSADFNSTENEIILLRK